MKIPHPISREEGQISPLPPLPPWVVVWPRAVVLRAVTTTKVREEECQNLSLLKRNKQEGPEASHQPGCQRLIKMNGSEGSPREQPMLETEGLYPGLRADT